MSGSDVAPTRVVLVEDHRMFRQALARTLDWEPGFSVVGQAGSVAEALELGEPFDVAVVDVQLPDGSGLDLIRPLLAGSPGSAVLVVTASAERGDVARAIEAGAAGVLHKSADVAEIVSAARRAAAGEPLLSPRETVELLRLSGRLREEGRDARLRLGQLTAREREVLQALAEGLNDAQIAERLTISVETSRTHAARILAKLEVSSRLQAVVYAARHSAVRLG